MPMKIMSSLVKSVGVFICSILLTKLLLSFVGLGLVAIIEVISDAFEPSAGVNDSIEKVAKWLDPAFEKVPIAIVVISLIIAILYFRLQLQTKKGGGNKK